MDFDNNTPNGFARTSRILGFVALAFGFGCIIMPLFAPVSLMAGMLSIAFGIVSRSQTGKFQNHAITGIVCSGVTLAFMLIVAIFLLAFFNTAGGQQIVAESLKQYNELMNAYNEFYGN
ncbi:MAG: hypothetical protein J6B06_01335 [Lachnospiraceae bacterium]|nr:hypothetical protein [Lachnospiraceae bacterium]